MTSTPADFKFLFRFRDLIADTVKQHTELIAEQNACWWGWWQRPSETTHTDVWSELRADIEAAGAAVVGLFDSGTGTVYRATVASVIEPHEVDGAGATVTPPNAELELIPSYYRQSPFNKAWMKLTAIQKYPNFFGSYSFSAAPKLPNYDDVTLNKLKDKVILSDQELRGMDTTIWRVRPRAKLDTETALVLTTQALAKAESDHIVRVHGNAILHLTDIHFAVGAHRDHHVWRLETETDTRRTMVDAIYSAVKDLDIGLVVVTGDLTFKGSAEEFYEARAALMRLLLKLSLDVDRLVVIPGNHDIQWANAATYDEDAVVSQASPKARANYEHFYRELFRHVPSEHLAMARRFGLPNGMIVEICALNSSSLETGPKFLAGMGRTDEAAFTDAAGVLSWSTTSSLSFRMLALHHHLAVTEDVEPAAGYGLGYGMAVDAIRVQRMAAAMGVHLALHGHKHRAFVWRSTVYELPEHAQKKHRLGELSILGGGSVGSKETESGYNYFNVLNFTPTQLSVDIYRAGSAGKGAFGHFQTWNARLRLDETRGGIALDDWQE